MENVVVAVFPVESEAYQAFSRIKDGTTELSGYLVSQMAIVKKMGNNVQLEDEFDTGMKTSDDTISGGLIGALIGILGGPLGILLGGGIGTLIGSSIDLGDIDTNNSMIERVSCILCDGDTALIAFVQEDNTMYFDNVLNTFQDVSITRWDAAILEQEIETARVLQEEFEKTAKKELREKKSQERKMKAEERRAKMKHEIEQLKEKKHNK